MKNKMFLLLIIVMSIFFTTNLNAQVRPGTFSLSPNIGGYFFDHKQDIENSWTYGLGLGYDFTEQIGIEGSINRLDTKTEIGKTDVKGYLSRLDALVYFTSEKKFAPYFAFGVGNLSLKRSGSKSISDTVGDYGLGMKYFFNDNIAFRTDIRHVLPNSGNDFLVTAGLSFNFGGKKKTLVVEEKPAPQVAPPKDSDGDGVTDDKDQCPNTPAGVKVDSVGCPLDSDKDGVPDYLDKCPNTPAGVKVDSVGCPPDSDKDGVTDDKDQCPNTPAGIKVDNKGCPVDSDEDSVTDDKDQCPNTPKGATVDSRGCWIIKGLNFDTSKAVIKKDGSKLLDEVIPIMQANPSLKLEIQGHTDNKGTDAYNKKLSTKRAQAVMDYMVKKGIGKDRLSAVGYGFEKPAASNGTEDGRAENRRVELTPVQ